MSETERLAAPNPCAKIFEHKWLDPLCVENGCQSLMPEGRQRGYAELAGRLTARVAALEAALAPFGAEGLSEISDDTILTVMWEERRGVFRGVAAVRMGDLRRARAVLGAAPADAPESDRLNWTCGCYTVRVCEQHRHPKPAPATANMGGADAPEGPWRIEEYAYASDTFFVTRDNGKSAALLLTEVEALAVRDALNRVSRAVSEPNEEKK